MNLKIKSHKILYMILIIILIIAQPIYYQYYNNIDNISVYKIEKTIGDLSLTIENLTLVSTEKGVYIQPDWFIRPQNGSENKVEKIKLILSIDKRKIFTDYTSELTEKSSSDTPMFINNVNIKDESVLDIDITYSVNGKSKQFNEDIRLKDQKIELVKY